MSSNIIQRMREEVPQEVIDKAVSEAVSAEKEASKKALDAVALNMLKAGSSGTFILQCFEKMTRTDLEKLAAENDLSVSF